MNIKTKGLTATSLYKYIFLGYLIPLSFFCVCAGIASFFGSATITINNQVITGWQGLISGFFLGPIFSLIFAFFNWVVIGLGIWLYTRLKPIELHLKTDTPK